ncbi:Rieske (2Fe-2S) protein [Streptomyces sp. BI20]|uniref:Rieske (2Fe-2S) protein n=1 Tax=Streptomyces sp. BI20 TaxID=3403460 RepID=UPI003C7166AB
MPEPTVDPTPPREPAGTNARRGVLALGAAALTGGALVACGAGTNAGGTAPTGSRASTGGATGRASTPAASIGPDSGPPTTAAPSASASGSASPAGRKLPVKAADVPVGGGTVLKDEKLVITQPTAGAFHCFTAVCTHQGCLVNKVAAGTIDCPCHGSRFADTDGAVRHGPATRPLAEKPITVSASGEISLA